MNPRSTSVCTSCTRRGRPHRRLQSRIPISLQRVDGNAHPCPLSAAPVTIASNRPPILEASSMRRRIFRPAVPPCWHRLPFRCSAGRAPSLFRPIRDWRPGHRRLDHPLGDQIGKTPVRGRGMSISLTASPKWPMDTSSGNSTTYSPAPISLMIVRERSGKRSGSADFCASGNVRALWDQPSGEAESRIARPPRRSAPTAWAFGPRVAARHNFSSGGTGRSPHWRRS